MTKNTEGLTLRLLFVPNQVLRMCPYGTYLLLRSIEYVLRERNVLLRSLESLICMYTAVRWTVTVSLSCVGVLKGVTFDKCHCKWCKIPNPGVLKWVSLMNVTANDVKCFTIQCTEVLKGVKSYENSCEVFYCTVPLPNGLQISQFTAYDVLSSEGSWKESRFRCVWMVLKEIIFWRQSPMEIW